MLEMQATVVLYFWLKFQDSPGLVVWQK